MAFAVNNCKNDAAPEVVKPKVTVEELRKAGASVSRARQMSDNVLVFNLRFGCVDLYGMRAISSDRGDFVAAGQSKGRDGKWYDNYRIYLNKGANDAIIKAVLSCLETDSITEV
jgi:hypothetical protein